MTALLRLNRGLRDFTSWGITLRMLEVHSWIYLTSEELLMTSDLPSVLRELGSVVCLMKIVPWNVKGLAA